MSFTLPHVDYFAYEVFAHELFVKPKRGFCMTSSGLAARPNMKGNVGALGPMAL